MQNALFLKIKCMSILQQSLSLLLLVPFRMLNLDIMPNNPSVLNLDIMPNNPLLLPDRHITAVS